jgi:hypothetical protein
MTVVSPYFTFPRISWWMQVLKADKIIFDTAEHYQKMSYRNRYRISGSNNSILLSIPLQKGREQRTPMSQVRIYNVDNWQTQHWRTLVSVYKRTPYFEHYEPGLQQLFTQQFTHLAAFNAAAFNWVKQQLRLPIATEETSEYMAQYPDGILDLRAQELTPASLPVYYQVFEDRIGFQPDLSILDLLFSEGPTSISKLK